MENSEGFDFNQFFIKFRIPIFILLAGLLLLGLGIIFYRSFDLSSTKVEIINGTVEGASTMTITVEISGAVQKPGVYKMESDARINDLLITAGGVTALADKSFLDKYINKASKLNDGQKVYIPKEGFFDPAQDERSRASSAKTTGVDQTASSTFSGTNTELVNINTASLKELDSLPGIGPTFAQNIIDHRPYSTLEELVSKGAIKKSLLDKIKERLTIY